FTVDEITLVYLRTTGRSKQQIALVEAYCKEQGLFRTGKSADAEYSQVVELDLSAVEPSVAGPRRPQDRAPLSKAKESFTQALPSLIGPRGTNGAKAAPRQVARLESEGGTTAIALEDPHAPAAEKTVGNDVFNELHDGSVVIAAITSCTNTSNP